MVCSGRILEDEDAGRLRYVGLDELEDVALLLTKVSLSLSPCSTSS